MSGGIIREPKIGRQQNARLKPQQRTYADSARLWRDRHGAPVRNTLLKAFFAPPGSKGKLLNFEGPSVFARDGEQEREDGVRMQEPFVGIDDNYVIYFLSREQLRGGDDEDASDNSIKGYYLLKSRHSYDHESAFTGGAFPVYEIAYEKLLLHAPKLSRKQLGSSHGGDGGRGRGRYNYNEKRFANIGWPALLDDTRHDTMTTHLQVEVEQRTRKNRMTTGSVTLVQK